MLSNKQVERLLPIGYTFIFKGEYCWVIKRFRNRFEYSTMEKPSGNYMYYDFFQNTPHFRSKYKKGVGRQKSLDFEPGFLPLVNEIVENIKKGKSPNQKIYML
jgi:hypothetical protein